MRVDNHVSGFVSDKHFYTGMIDFFPQWTFTQYDSDGKTLVNPDWMSRHKEVEIKNISGTVIKYEYREMLQVLFAAGAKTRIKIDIYNYHGGELRIVPDKKAKDFSIFYRDKLVSTFKRDKDKNGYNRLDLP